MAGPGPDRGFWTAGQNALRLGLLLHMEDLNTRPYYGEQSNFFFSFVWLVACRILFFQASTRDGTQRHSTAE